LVVANDRYGNDALKVAAEGMNEKWHMRREFVAELHQQMAGYS